MASAVPAMTITAGEIQVGEAYLVLNTPQARAWDVDVISKYAAVFGLGAGQVLLGATGDTLAVNETARGQLTVLTFDVPDGWSIIADCSRYTCRVVAFEPSYSTKPKPSTVQDRLGPVVLVTFVVTEDGEPLKPMTEAIAKVQLDAAGRPVSLEDLNTRVLNYIRRRWGTPV